MADEIFAQDTRRLELLGSAHRLRLAALAEPPPGYRGHADAPLYAVRFTGAPARVDADRDRVRVRYPGWLRSLFGTRSTDLALNPYVRWHIAMRGGLGQSELDLSHLQVDALDLHGGLDRTTLRLPLPAGELAVALRGGANRLRLVCPPGAALRVRIDGGVTRLQIDTLHVGTVGDRFAWQTPDFTSNPRRLDIRLRGGASDLAVDWPCDPLALQGPFAPTRLAAWPRLFGGSQ